MNLNAPREREEIIIKLQSQLSDMKIALEIKNDEFVEMLTHQSDLLDKERFKYDFLENENCDLRSVINYFKNENENLIRKNNELERQKGLLLVRLNHVEDQLYDKE